MDDEIPNGSWRLDAGMRVAMRLEAVRRHLGEGDAAQAQVEAEELLDEAPDQPEALFLLGEASLELSQPEVAVEAYRSAVAAGLDGADVHVGLALAWFELCRFGEAEATARRAVGRAPDHAEGHHVLGLALERQPGRETEAATEITLAQRLDPERFPFPLRLRAADWDRAVQRALGRVHPTVAEFWQGVPIEWHDFPDGTALPETHPGVRPTVGGLYAGTPPESDDPWTSRPAALRLYRRNLARAPTHDALADDLAAVFEAEALDWLGWGVEDLDREGGG